MGFKKKKLVALDTCWMFIRGNMAKDVRITCSLAAHVTSRIQKSREAPRNMPFPDGVPGSNGSPNQRYFLSHGSHGSIIIII
jgi:hypothetical protein